MVIVVGNKDMIVKVCCFGYFLIYRKVFFGWLDFELIRSIGYLEGEWFIINGVFGWVCDFEMYIFDYGNFDIWCWWLVIRVFEGMKWVYIFWFFCWF